MDFDIKWIYLSQESTCRHFIPFYGMSFDELAIKKHLWSSKHIFGLAVYLGRNLTCSLTLSYILCT